MKIAINCWVLRNKQLDGIGNFTIETLRPLIIAHPEIEFLILCDKDFTENYFDYPNVKKAYIFPALRHPVLYLFYFECIIPAFLKKHKPDLFVSMDGFLSLSSKCRQLPVIYDLNFEHYPKDLKLKNRIYFRFFFKRFAKKAVRIATISEYSKKDIANLYNINPGKIDNVSCGIKDKFQPLSEIEKTNTRKKYSAGENYFFFVGSMHPRKNISRLLLAFNAFKLNSGSPFKLILAGHILWDDEGIKKILDESTYKRDIIFSGRVTDEELKLLLGSAWCLTFIPTFEGFGLPIVEAFQAGVPVICSNTTSMPEVAGNAAIQVNPFDINEIVKAMEKLNENNLLRNELITNGFQRKNLFTWEKTASLLYECIMKVIRD